MWHAVQASNFLVYMQASSSFTGQASQSHQELSSPKKVATTSSGELVVSETYIIRYNTIARIWSAIFVHTLQG